MDYNDRKIILNKLKEKPFIKQRTDEWFSLRQNILTASDLYDAIYHPASLIKKKIKNASFNSYAIPALKWGCMFEPIAIDIYGYLNKTKINEFGLLVNNNIENFGASPDGITDEGIMIEIKCPYSREIKDNVIPDKYYYQMQGQMAVCELDICDYTECKFITFKDQDEYIQKVENLETYKHGIIADLGLGNYKYSTFDQNYKLNIDEMKEYDNCIYWKLDIIYVQRVKFDVELWNNTIKSNIINYWNMYQNELKNSDKKNKNLFIEDSD
jgi:putative phage-type endonuclease